MEERTNQWLGPLAAFKVLYTQNIRTPGQHFKFDVDLLSYFPDAKLQHSSQMKLKKCV